MCIRDRRGGLPRCRQSPCPTQNRMVFCVDEFRTFERKANTTDDCFEQMVAGHEMKDIGFLNRLLVVTGRSSHEIDVNENPPEDRVRALQDKLKSYFQMLAEREDA